MKNIVYAAKHVFKWKINNLVKVFTLSIGFGLGALMLTRIAYDFTYDGFYPDAKQIYLVYNDYTVGAQSQSKLSWSFSQLAPAIKEEISGIQAATRFNGVSNIIFVQEDKEYGINVLSADEHYFDVFGYEFIKGDPSRFAQPGTLFLSEQRAAQLFGDADPMDQILHDKDGNSYSVGALFKDMPHNTSWQVDAVAYLPPSYFPTQWNTGSWMINAVKVEKGADISQLDAQLETLLHKHYAVDDANSQNVQYHLYFHPLDTHHQVQGSAAEANLIVTLFGILILCISGLNYVILTLSSLESRAKEIGVRKCNGASRQSIFGLLFDESLIYCVLGIIFGVIVLMVAKTPIERITNGPLQEIFSLQNIYATFLVALVLLALTSVIPARLFASIPVTQVFHNKLQGRMPWKQGLLFVQLFASVFIISYLWMNVRQNNVLWKRGPGYTTENIAVFKFQSADISKAYAVRDYIDNIKPQVVRTSLASNIPLDNAKSGNIYNLGSDLVLFNSKIIYADNDFLELYQIPLLHGIGLENMQDSLHAIVTPLFIKHAKWETEGNLESIIGRQFHWIGDGQDKILTISGICQDFHLNNLKMEAAPLVITGYPTWTPESSLFLAAAVDEMDQETLASFTQKVQEIVPTSPVYSATYSQLYYDAHRAEVGSHIVAILAAVAIITLTLVGIISFISSELSRRRKEIAIRRLNGGTYAEVLAIVTRTLMWYTLAACVSASLLSFYMAGNWLKDFAVKATLPFWMYVASSLIIFAVVLIICILQSLKIISGNPVNHLKAD